MCGLRVGFGGGVSVYQKIGLLGLLAMVVLGVLAVLPPEHTHAHSVGPHDDLEKIPLEEGTPLEQIAEPVYDLWYFVMPDVASAHYPFPKYCGHGNFVKPNHNYYYEGRYSSGAYHYHKGYMDHAVGGDYDYRFRCGGPGGHYKTLPNGWW